VDKFNTLSQIFSFLRFSCYKTLVSKFKVSTVKQLLKKFGKNLEKITEIQLCRPSTKKIPLTVSLKQKKLNKLIV